MVWAFGCKICSLCVCVCVRALRSESGQHRGPYGKEFAGLQKILLLGHPWSNYEPGCQSYKSTVVSAEGRWYPTYPITWSASTEREHWVTDVTSVLWRRIRDTAFLGRTVHLNLLRVGEWTVSYMRRWCSVTDSALSHSGVGCRSFQERTPERDISNKARSCVFLQRTKVTYVTQPSGANSPQ